MALIQKPNVTKETAHGICEVSMLTHLLSNRCIFINGEITPEMADDFVKQMMILEEERYRPITVVIHSNGGNVNAGLLICDVIQNCMCEVNLIGMGICASMGAIILSSGDKGHRFVLPRTEVMIHEVMTRGGIEGSATSIKKVSESILKTKSILNRLLSQQTGRTIEEIDEATSFDNYMNAEEAVSFGLCDGIIYNITERIETWNE